MAHELVLKYHTLLIYQHFSFELKTSSKNAVIMLQKKMYQNV